MDILTPSNLLHRSTPDWSLSAGCHLDPARFISPPFSISDTLLLPCWAVLLHPDCLNIPYGRLTLWGYIDPAGDISAKFRCQSIGGPADPPLCYAVIIDPPEKTWLVVWMLPDPPIIGQWNHIAAVNVWTQYRITWTPACAPDALSSLDVRLEVLAGPGVGDYGILSDPLNRWADSPINRVGFSTERFAQQWMDDFLVETYP